MGSGLGRGAIASQRATGSYRQFLKRRRRLVPRSSEVFRPRRSGGRLKQYPKTSLAPVGTSKAATSMREARSDVRPFLLDRAWVYGPGHGTMTYRIAGGHMSVRSWSTSAVLSLGLVVVAPASASAEAPGATPGQRGVQGCRENGQAISRAARTPGAFGQMVRGAAPIADHNALFFASLCAGTEG